MNKLTHFQVGEHYTNDQIRFSLDLENLGEICYRFNHRKQDLKPLLLKLMRQTTVSEIKPILVRLV